MTVQEFAMSFANTAAIRKRTRQALQSAVPEADVPSRTRETVITSEDRRESRSLEVSPPQDVLIPPLFAASFLLVDEKPRVKNGELPCGTSGSKEELEEVFAALAKAVGADVEISDSSSPSSGRSKFETPSSLGSEERENEARPQGSISPCPVMKRRVVGRNITPSENT